MKKTFILLLSLLIPFTVFAEKDNFFSRAGSDIVAYFNTYYNAKEYYKEAQELYEEEEDKDKLGAKARAALNKAIKQTELVISKFPNSSFIDDCLFMNSICQYEMSRYEKALEQLEDLVLTFPDSPYYYEAKLWISKAYFQMDKKTIAYDLLEQFLSNNKNRPYFSDAYSLMGFLALQENNKEKALDAFVRSADLAYTKEDRCNMYLQAADLMIENENYDEALKLTHKAGRSIKFDEQRARVQITYTHIYRLQGNEVEAFRVIDESKLDARIEQYLGDIIYEEANIYFSQDEEDRGVKLLRKIVADNNYKKNRDSKAWVRSAYRLGKYYLYEADNIDSAKFYFNQAKNKKRQAEEGQLGENYLKKINDIKKMDTALKNLVKKSPAMADSAWVQYEILKDSSDSEMKKRELIFADTLSMDSLQIDSVIKAVDRQYYRYDKALKSYVSSANVYVGNMYTLAALYLFDLEMPDTAMSIYRNIEKEFYFTEEIPKAIYSQSYVWEYEYDNKEKADSVKRELTLKYPDSEISNYILGKVPKDSIMYYENQEKIYEIEKVYIDHERYEEGVLAIKELLRSDNIDPKNHAMLAYKVAWLYDNELSRTQNTQDSTMKYYRIVQNRHPESKYASRSALRVAAIETDISDYLAFLAGDSLSKDEVNIDSTLYADSENGSEDSKRKEHPLYRRMKSPGRPRPQRL